jgi:hypothetical protein
MIFTYLKTSFLHNFKFIKLFDRQNENIFQKYALKSHNFRILDC